MAEVALNLVALVVCGVIASWCLMAMQFVAYDAITRLRLAPARAVPRVVPGGLARARLRGRAALAPPARAARRPAPPLLPGRAAMGAPSAGGSGRASAWRSRSRSCSWSGPRARSGGRRFYGDHRDKLKTRLVLRQAVLPEALPGGVGGGREEGQRRRSRRPPGPQQRPRTRSRTSTSRSSTSTVASRWLGRRAPYARDGGDWTVCTCRLVAGQQGGLLLRGAQRRAGGRRFRSRGARRGCGSRAPATAPSWPRRSATPPVCTKGPLRAPKGSSARAPWDPVRYGGAEPAPHRRGLTAASRAPGSWTASEVVLRGGDRALRELEPRGEAGPLRREGRRLPRQTSTPPSGRSSSERPRVVRGASRARAPGSGASPVPPTALRKAVTASSASSGSAKQRGSGFPRREVARDLGTRTAARRRTDARSLPAARSGISSRIQLSVHTAMIGHACTRPLRRRPGALGSSMIAISAAVARLSRRSVLRTSTKSSSTPRASDDALARSGEREGDERARPLQRLQMADHGLGRRLAEQRRQDGPQRGEQEDPRPTPGPRARRVRRRGPK